MRTALVGCGKVGSLHAQALATLPQSQLVAVIDHDLGRAKAFAEKYGGVAGTDAGQTGAEAVFLCTPHPLHADAAIAAMGSGAHVLVEKPLAATSGRLRPHDRRRSSNGVQLGVVSQRRLYEPVQRMKQAIEAGKIGRPIAGDVAMFSWRDEAYYRSDPWRGKWDTEGGGVLINQSPHHLDLLQWFMGEVEEVSGAAVNLNHPYIEVEDTASATLRFAGGGIGNVVVSLSQKPGLYTKIHVHGENGASVGAETDSGATFIAGMSGPGRCGVNDIWTVPGEEHLLAGFQKADRERAPVDYHSLEIARFLDSLIAGKPVPVPATEGRKVVAIIDAIYRSSRRTAGGLAYVSARTGMAADSISTIAARFGFCVRIRWSQFASSSPSDAVSSLPICGIAASTKFLFAP